MGIHEVVLEDTNDGLVAAKVTTWNMQCDECGFRGPNIGHGGLWWQLSLPYATGTDDDGDFDDDEWRACNPDFCSRACLKASVARLPD